MSFLKEFKEDFLQAVNELGDEVISSAEVDDNDEVETTISDQHRLGAEEECAGVG